METSFIPIPITLAVFGHALLAQQYITSGWIVLGIALVIAIGGFVFEVTHD